MATIKARSLAQEKAVVRYQAHGHARRARNRDCSLNIDRLAPRAGEHLFDQTLEERRFRKSLARRRGREAFLEIRADPGGEMRAATLHAADLNQTAVEKLAHHEDKFLRKLNSALAISRDFWELL